jgi:Response receiver domain
VSFRELSCAVAREFLQSVIVFDDRVELGEQSRGSASESDTEEIEADASSDPFGETPGELTAPRVPPGSAPVETGVNVKRLADAFAEKGLICGVLQPGPAESEDEANLLLTAARRADIVVLDWVIERDEGDTARRIVDTLLRSDREAEEERLRLIAIYTSQSDLDTIVDRLDETLGELTGEPARRDGYALTSCAARIVVLAKQSSGAVGEAAARRVVEEDLPQRLIEAFADFTMGLVPNVVLAGLAAVRTDIYRVLQVLDRRLDPAYVGQWLLLANPGEPEEQLVELLASELRSVMEDREVGAQAGGGALAEWFKWQMEDGPFATWEGVDSGKRDEEVRALLKHGIASDDQPVKDLRSRNSISKSKSHLRAARLFAPSDEAADRANDKFAMRFTLRTHYSNPARVMQLGTLVEADEGYLLCVQPVCDSLRIRDGDRAFPFLPLVHSEDAFDVVIDRRGERVTLQLERKPYCLQHFRFPTDDETRCVVAVPDGDEYVFNDTDGATFRWVGRLQTEHGQRVVHQLGSGFSRVGLSESEWLRRESGQGDD